MLTEDALKAALETMDASLKRNETPSLTGAHLDFHNKAFPRSDALQNLDLRFAQLRSADLRSQQFGSSNVADADFSDCDLTDADLSLVQNLLPHQLSGANLTRCKLPKSVAKFEALSNVAELSKNAGKLFSTMIGLEKS